MFGIHWYSGALLIERQTSGQTFLAEVVATMRSEAAEVSARNPSNVPDTFRVYDGLGREMGHYTLR